jgi:malonate transporter and related proteins
MHNGLATHLPPLAAPAIPVLPMIVVLGILLPVFGLIAIGYGMARTPLLKNEGVRGLGSFVYYVALPALLFRSTALPPPGESGGGAILFALGMALARGRFAMSLSEQGIVGVNASFGNSVQMGVPLVLAAFGPAGMHAMALVIALQSIILLTLATIVVELGGWRGGAALGRSLSGVLKALVTNPIIMAIVAGFLWRRAGLTLPTALLRLIELLADGASPCALFALGASLAGFRLTAGLGDTALVVGLKLLVQPLTVWALAHLLGLAPLDLAVVTLAAALPIGMNAFIMAQGYQLHVAQSASAVVLSNLLSVLTLGAVLGFFAVPPP